MLRWSVLFLAVVLAPASVTHAEDQVRPITRVSPDYPADAFEKEVAGRVKAWLVVDDDGDVTDVEIISESPTGFGFAEAARDAFAEWTYPGNAAGRYRASFTFEIVPLELTPEEAALSLAAPPTATAWARMPAGARDSGVAGQATVVATIDEKGNVESVRIAKQSPPGYGFGEAARDAVLHYEFRPGPRSVWATTIDFSFYDPDGTAEMAMPEGELPAAPTPRRAGSPEYPYKARGEGVEGWADLGVQIDKRGRITHAAVLAEQPLGYGFGKSAYKSLSWWRFDDTRPGTYRLRVEFKLDE